MMGLDLPATAEGDLGRTPFGHLLVYALDRRLTGALFLHEPSGVVHAVQLSRGVPVKMRPGDRYALLGEMLVEASAVSPATIEQAVATKGLLGDVLVLAGCVDRDILEHVAEQQFIRRMVRLFRLPKETTYRYCDGHDELLEYGGEPANVDPMTLLWTGMRTHGEASTMMRGTLALLGDAALRLHPLATTTRFGLTEDEERVITAMEDGPTPMSQLLARGYVSEEMLRKLCYTLLMTRQIELGTGTLPVGAIDPRRSTPVARMHLRPSAYRVGAAAPDPPGDGERSTGLGRRLGEPRAAPFGEPLRATADAPRRASSSPAPPPAPQAAPQAMSAPSAEPGQSSPPPADDPRATLRSAAVPLLPGASFEQDPRSSDPGVAREPVWQEEPASPLHGGSSEGHGEVQPSLSVCVRGKPSAVSGSAAQVTVLSAPALYQLATTRLAERDFDGSLEACTMARKAAPGEPDYRALSVWIRAQMPAADIQALTIELDELVAANDAHVAGRYFRALLRRRLGDDLGAIGDLRRVIELVPAHGDAARELALLESRRPKERAGLLGRLFRR
jgi:hypothetical protein